MKNKLFIVLEGGLVQDVLTTSEEVFELHIIDHDCQEGDEDSFFQSYQENLKELENATDAVSLMFE